MNVGELRKLLKGVDDDLPVIIDVEYGYGCRMVVTDVDGDISTLDVESTDDSEEMDEIDCVKLTGVEDTRYTE